MKKKERRKITSWAKLRFSVIGGLLASPPKKGELFDAIKELSYRYYQHPTKDCLVRFGASTIERWYYKALNSDDPVKALKRKIRSDLGEAKAVNTQLLMELQKQYTAYSHWSYKLHADNLRALVNEKPNLGIPPSYSTIVRTMKKQGWYKKPAKPRNPTPGQIKSRERLEQREVRSFEAQHVHALWHLDFHECSRHVVDSNGKWHKACALCILDDHSRLCCHIQWYLGSENAQYLYHGLKQAFHKRGLPRSLMTDQGSAMKAEETENGLLSAGVQHDLTLAYSPYQNGKQESFWAQLEGRFVSMLHRVEPLTLEVLNQYCHAWIEQEYNRTVHSEIKTTPLKRALTGKDVSRPSPSSRSLQCAFTKREKRTQRKSDSTISIQGVRFEIPSRFRHVEHLWVRYQSWDRSQAFLVDGRTDNPLADIYPQNKTKNFNAVRRNLAPLTENSGNDVDSNPIPPLLRRYLAEYAQTGMPAAYIPLNNKKEEQDE